jgi:hypothetical protein
MSNIFDQLSGARADAQTRPHETAPDTHHQTSAPNITSAYTRQIKATTQELLKFGLLEASNKSKHYHTCLHQKELINAILDPLDLQLKIDDTRGLAFLVVATTEELEHKDAWQHPLVRRQRMNLEQSLMVAILRQHYLNHEQEAGTGSLKAIVHLDDLLPQLNQFLGASGSEERDEKRLRNLLEQLRGYALVSEIDDNDKITIRPLITHLNNPEHLQNLIAELRQYKHPHDKDTPYDENAPEPSPVPGAEHPSEKGF